MNATQLLLQILHAMLEVDATDQVSAERMHYIAQKLTFDSRRILESIKELERQGLLQLHWGASVAITEQGKAFLYPPQPPIPKNSPEYTDSYTDSDAQLRDGVTASEKQGDVEPSQGSEDHRIVANLVAAHLYLTHTEPVIGFNQRIVPLGTPRDELLRELDALRDELRNPAPKEALIEQHLGRALQNLETLTRETKEISGPNLALQILGRSLEWIRVHHRSIKPWPFITL